MSPPRPFHVLFALQPVAHERYFSLNISLLLFHILRVYALATRLLGAALDLSMYQFLYIEVDDARYLW